MSLEEYLKSKTCFKLVCGAGNEDAHEVEKLVTLYATAGARYFDLSAREDVVLAAKSALERVYSKGMRDECFLNVSVGIKGDPHVSKAKIDQYGCALCGDCKRVCLQKAIDNDGDSYTVITSRCIGCGACIQCCPVQVISSYSENKPLDEVLPPLIRHGLDSIELHAVSDDDEGVAEQWDIISKYFDGVLSLCLDRSQLSDLRLINRIKELIESRPEYSTIIQADGAPMSGCDDKYSTTLQALGTAQIVQRAKLPVFLMLSGGTNSKTTEMARLFGIDAHGVALGSYARMIVREYIDRDDFLSNEEVFCQALLISKALVKNSLKYMNYNDIY
jgi:Fe-S-cluster-containing hydrogenase component 2